MISSTGKPTSDARRQQGFTLIELMLVLILLTIVISLVTPTLQSFFGGRDLDSEIRRFVSLTHYAQDRAVSEGVPMFLWVDPKAGAYGLQQETGYTDGDTKAVDYQIADGLTISVGNAGLHAPAAKLSGLHFSPDGNAITDKSVSGVSIQQRGYSAIWIVPSANGMTYEVRK